MITKQFNQLSQFLGTIENHEPGTKEAIETKQQKNPLG